MYQTFYAEVDIQGMIKFSQEIFSRLVMQSNNKKKQKKRIWATSREPCLQWLLRESLDLQNNHKGLGFHNIQHVYSLSRVTLK
jgi:hypothetical protein